MNHALGLGVVCLALVGCSAEQGPQEQIAIQHVMRGELRVTLREQGEVQSAQVVELASRVEGRRTVLYLAPEGSIVAAGDRVAELDISGFEDRRAVQAIAVARARSAHEQAKKNFEIVERALEASRTAAEGKLEMASMRREQFIPSATRTDESELGTHAEMVGKLRDLLGDEAARRYAGLEAELLELLGTEDSLRTRTGEMASRVLRKVSEVELSTARLNLSRQRYEQTRKLYERGTIDDHELRVEATAYETQVSATDLAWNDLQMLIKFTLKEERELLQQDFRNAELALDSVLAKNDGTRSGQEAELRSVDAELALASERLDHWDQQIRASVIEAPSAGLVVYARTSGPDGRVPLREGLEVHEGQVLVILPNTDNMIVELRVAEADVDQVAVGQKVSVRVDTYPDRTFTGSVSQISSLPDSGTRWIGNNLKVYEVTVALDGGNPDAALRPGMNGSVEILVDVRRDVLYVPPRAVHTEEGGTHVWMAMPNGPQAVAVTLGARNGEQVEIASGLREGDQVYLGRPVGAVRR